MSAKALVLHQMQQIYDTTTPDSKVQVIDAHRQAVIFCVYRSSR